MTSDDELLFAGDDAVVPEPEASEQPWIIAIIDDDTEVHIATRLALSDAVLLGRKLRFVSAHSAAEAREILPRLRNVAVILLDVVMESDHAGLSLVQFIRDDLGWQMPRIILRTGQPGTAPEREVIVEYDINDYKSKVELTETRLFTAVLAALRSYRHLMHLETSRAGLRKVIDAAASLHQIDSMQRFAEGVLLQLTAILESDAHSILCVHRRANEATTITLLAGSGRFNGVCGRTADDVLDTAIHTRLLTTLHDRHSQFHPASAALYLNTPTGREVVVYIENDRPFSDLDLSLLELFGHNISVGYDNVEMYHQLRAANAQLEEHVAARTRELSLREADLRRFKAAVDHSSASILITDANGMITYVNPALTRTSLYSADQLIGAHPRLFKSGMVPASVFEEMWAQISAGHDWRGELLNRKSSGELYWEDVAISPVMDEAGSLTHFVAIKDDISERKKLEDELRRLAMIDPLTGVLNRRSFFALAEQEVSRCRRHPGELAVIMLDIDHFKQVNDNFGHQAGDEVLRLIASVFNAALRDNDVIGRLGGEEFACILPATPFEQAMMVAERLRGMVGGEPTRLASGIDIRVTISLGIATLRSDDANLAAVLSRADAALYDAKQTGRNRTRFAG